MNFPKEVGLLLFGGGAGIAYLIAFLLFLSLIRRKKKILDKSTLYYHFNYCICFSWSLLYFHFPFNKTRNIISTTKISVKTYPINFL